MLRASSQNIFQFIAVTDLFFYGSELFSGHTSHRDSLGKKATVHQVTTMLSTSKNVLFPGHNHLLTTGADDPTL